MSRDDQREESKAGEVRRPEQELQSYLAVRSGRKVYKDWKSAQQVWRFYFGEPATKWALILDLPEDQVSETSLEHLVQQLETANWIGKISTGKRFRLAENGQLLEVTGKQ